MGTPVKVSITAEALAELLIKAAVGGGAAKHNEDTPAIASISLDQESRTVDIMVEGTKSMTEGTGIRIYQDDVGNMWYGGEKRGR